MKLPWTKPSPPTPVPKPARCALPGHDQVGCECDSPFTCT